MKSISITLVLDFPLSVQNFSIFDIGKNKPYIDWTKTGRIFQMIYNEFISAQLKVLVNQLQKSETYVSVYVSGHFLTLLDKTDPDMLDQIKELVSSGKIEILGGTYNLSLSSIYSFERFEAEVEAHMALMKNIFGVKPTKFYNTENIYFNLLCEKLISLKFKSVFSGTISWYLGDLHDKRVFHSASSNKFNVLLTDTDEGHAVFSQKDRTLHFLQFDLKMLKKLNGLENILKTLKPIAQINSIDQILALEKADKPYSIKSPVMGSIHMRSLPNYTGHAMQANAIDHFYLLSKKIDDKKKTELNQACIDLGKSINFLNMTVSDDDHVSNSYDDYSRYVNILSDLELLIDKK